MQLTITHTESEGWVIEYDGKKSVKMGWDEMMGLVASITMPEPRPCLQWLQKF